MKKLLVFTGESGSGKTTLIAKLIKRYPNQFKKVVTYTSRPKRVGEIDGIDYHFLPTEYFTDNPTLVLTKKTNEGFNYGTKKLDLFSNTHNLLLASKLTGIKKLIDLGLKNIIVIRISISDELKIKRMRQRNDTDEMIINRLRSDIENRTEVDLGQVPVINLAASQTIDEKIESIIERVDD